MPYATVIDVANRTAYRATYTASTVPTASQVIAYLQDSSAQLDAWLYGAGYAAPFDIAIASGLVATQSQLMLRDWNVTGAALMVEDAAQQTDRRKDYEERWEDICKQIFDSSWDFNLPRFGAKAYPRGFGRGQGPVTDPGFTFDINPRVGQGQPGQGNWDL